MRKYARNGAFGVAKGGLMLAHINTFLSGVAVPLLLSAAGIFYGIKLRFFHLLNPRAVIAGLKQERRGGVSSAKAVALALAGTLGVGNIVGVSSAIYLGGFGAVLWMWISALVAMILKYAEIVLAVKYRLTRTDGSYDGSAMKYIYAFFTSLGFKRLARAVSGIFAALFLINAMTMGSMLQSGAISEALHGTLGLPRLYVGMCLAVITFFALRQGTGALTKITGALVPFMSVGYVLLSLVVIISNRDGLPDAFELIVRSAFDKNAAFAGTGGYAFAASLRYGVMRGLISNEAGCGTAPTAHAIANCSHPAKQGTWGIFEVFADTILLCTMTALCVILEYPEASRYGGNYMMMTLAAYSASLGSYAAYFLAAAVTCFGVATILCWAHYGLSATRFFSATRSARNKFAVAYCGCVALGAVMSSDFAWELADISMAIMIVINLTVICFMWREVRKETDDFLALRKTK